ncbi:hypothetical protein EVAR_63241_1 [Eumeta japonica]|uniref:Uncharacterized protein n=1 Tax=Eumeta variegata TaxID=151549 RepID=A0A4C1ZAA6_EUMVA|nr:hypothetical protein EVAR_63241_1 [Eumeta japonica]
MSFKNTGWCRPSGLRLARPPPLEVTGSVGHNFALSYKTPSFTRLFLQYISILQARRSGAPRCSKSPFATEHISSLTLYPMPPPQQMHNATFDSSSTFDLRRLACVHCKLAAETSNLAHLEESLCEARAIFAYTTMHSCGFTRQLTNGNRSSYASPLRDNASTYTPRREEERCKETSCMYGAREKSWLFYEN